MGQLSNDHHILFSDHNASSSSFSCTQVIDANLLAHHNHRFQQSSSVFAICLTYYLESAQYLHHQFPSRHVLVVPFLCLTF